MASLKNRNGIYYIQHYVAGQRRRISLDTSSYQIAKEKLRQFESAQSQGVANPLPGRTSIAQVVAAYVRHIRTFKTAKSAQTDVYYLREMFGPICSRRALLRTHLYIALKASRSAPRRADSGTTNSRRTGHPSRPAFSRPAFSRASLSCASMEYPSRCSREETRAQITTLFIVPP